MDLDLAQASRDGCLEREPATRRAPVVDLEDDKTLLRQHLCPQVHRLRPAVVHHLRSGTAVDGGDDGGGDRCRWTINRRVQLDPIAGAKRVEFRRRKVNGDVGRRMDRPRSMLVVQANNIDVRGLVEIVEDADIAGEIGCQDGAVYPGPARESLRFTTVRGDTEELAIEGSFLPANEIELAALLIEGVLRSRWTGPAGHSPRVSCRISVPSAAYRYRCRKPD